MKPDLSHVAYPLDDPIYGHCPSSHPHRFQTIHYEVSFATGDFNYRSGAFVFSFGDARWVFPCVSQGIIAET